LREELRASNKRRGDRSREDALAGEARQQRLFELLNRFVENPESGRTLLEIAELGGSDVAVKALRYMSKRKNLAFYAEALATRVLTLSGRGRTEHGKTITGWTKSSYGERLDLRKTLLKTVRSQVHEPVYKRRRRVRTATLIVDRSSSMRKAAERVLEIAVSYYPITENLVLFSDDVEVIRITPSLSRRFILERLLSLDFNGYTNISKALRSAERIAKSGSTAILISDMEQTVEDSPYVLEIEKLLRKRVKLVVYTLDEYIPELRRALCKSVVLKPLYKKALDTLGRL